MKTANALKKLDKSGFEIFNSGRFFTAKKPGMLHEIHFYTTDENTSRGFQVRASMSKDNVQIDYFPGTWCDNLTQAIAICN